MILTLMVGSLGCASDHESEASAESASNQVVATFSGGSISASELETTAGASLVKLRQDIYDAKVKALENEIFNRLVDAAAAAEGVDRAEYIKKNVADQLTPPSEEQIAQVLAQYRSRLPEDEEAARAQVLQFLSGQQRQAADAALRGRLFADADVQIKLDPPRVTYAVSETSPFRGPADAAVTLVEYTDYECPYCVRAQGTIDRVMARYGDTVRHVFKNLPLPMHPQARLAAEAALCAGDQGKFWEYHDWVFANRGNLQRDALIAQAGELGIDGEAFTTCVDEKTHAAAVQADMDEARGYGITGTPGFLVNGRVVTGAQPYETFAKIIDEELRRAGVPVPPEPAPVQEQPAEAAEGASS